VRNSETQVDNNAALTDCEPYMWQMIETVHAMGGAGESRDTQLENLRHVGLSGSIIGHPDVISEEQQMQDDIRRQTTAVSTDITHKVKDSICMATVSSGRYNFHITGYKKPLPEDPSTENMAPEVGSSTATASARRQEQHHDIDDLLSRVTFQQTFEDRGIPSAGQGPSKFSDRELLESLLMSLAENERVEQYIPVQSLTRTKPKRTRSM